MPAESASEDAKKKRISLACDDCKRRKYRCDGGKPSCAACIKSKLECRYTPRNTKPKEPPKPKGPRALHAAYLRERIQMLESRAAQLNLDFSKIHGSSRPGYDDDSDGSDGDEGALSSPISPDPTALANKPIAHPKASSIARNKLAAGASSHQLKSWDEEITKAIKDQATPPPDVVGKRLQCFCEDCYSKVKSEGTMHPDDFNVTVIPKSALKELVELFFACHYHVDPLPIFHRITFVKSLSSANPPSQLLLHAIYASAAPYSTHPAVLNQGSTDQFQEKLNEKRDRHAVGERFYTVARSLVMQNIECPSLPTVQALILIAHFSLMSGRLTAAWQYLAMAVEMATAMNLHVDPEVAYPNLTPVEKDVHRRTYWACYLQDRMISMAADRDFLIPVFPTINLPMPERTWESYWNLTSSSEGPGNGVDASSDAFCSLLMLMGIFTNIIEFGKIQSAPATAFGNLPAFELQSSVSNKRLELDMALDNWYRALPFSMSMRPLKADDYEIDLSMHPRPPMLTIFIHLVYNTCRSLLHRQPMMDVIKACHSNAKFDADFKICDQSTLENARILIEVLLAEPKSLMHMNSFLPYFIFQSCLVHIMIAQVPDVDRVLHTGCFRTRMHIQSLEMLGEYSYTAKPLATTLKCLIELASITREGTKERIWRRRQMQKAGIIPPDEPKDVALYGEAAQVLNEKSLKVVQSLGVKVKEEVYDAVQEDAKRLAESPDVAVKLVKDVAMATALAVGGDPWLVGAEPVNLVTEIKASDALKMHGPFLNYPEELPDIPLHPEIMDYGGVKGTLMSKEEWANTRAVKEHGGAFVNEENHLQQQQQLYQHHQQQTYINGSNANGNGFIREASSHHASAYPSPDVDAQPTGYVIVPKPASEASNTPPPSSVAHEHQTPTSSATTWSPASHDTHNQHDSHASAGHDTGYPDDMLNVEIDVMNTVLHDVEAALGCGLPDACPTEDVLGDMSVEDRAVWRFWNDLTGAQVFGDGAEGVVGKVEEVGSEDGMVEDVDNGVMEKGGDADLAGLSLS
ncbi:hypothetical protein HDU97_010243 [Phlyctochytrium planicorne]|nr:hypothetical protein HDU97_010243 [Phlyctochytrium planicorne]